MDNTFEMERIRSDKSGQPKELDNLGEPYKLLAFLCLFLFL
jgi:hypothetical protein